MENLEIDEIKELDRIKDAKELLDMGAITPEEFDKIKSNTLKKILNQPDDAEDMESEQINEEENKSSWDGTSFTALYPTPDLSTKARKKSKSKRQETIENAASQAANTASREITKGIMRGKF